MINPDFHGDMDLLLLKNKDGMIIGTAQAILVAAAAQAIWLEVEAFYGSAVTSTQVGGQVQAMAAAVDPRLCCDAVLTLSDIVDPVVKLTIFNGKSFLNHLRSIAVKKRGACYRCQRNGYFCTRGHGGHFRTEVAEKQRAAKIT